MRGATLAPLPAQHAGPSDLGNKSGQNADQVSRVQGSGIKELAGGPETCNLKPDPFAISRVDMPQQGALEKLRAIVFGGDEAQDLACSGDGPRVGARWAAAPFQSCRKARQGWGRQHGSYAKL